MKYIRKLFNYSELIPLTLALVYMFIAVDNQTDINRIIAEIWFSAFIVNSSILTYLRNTKC